MTRNIGKYHIPINIKLGGYRPIEAGGGNRVRLAIGALGLGTALSMLMWLMLGWAGAVPSMFDVFGVAGVRIPAGIAVGGLLLAAVGFNDF